jgi:hypothetical protein
MLFSTTGSLNSDLGKRNVMKILVCGGRDFGAIAKLNGNRKNPHWEQYEDEYKFVMAELDKLSQNWPKGPEDKYGNWLPDVFIISGGATGADSCALDWAIVNWCNFREYPIHQLETGFQRNVRMLADSKPDLVVAFPGGNGTAHMVKIARAAGVPVTEIAYE